MGLTGWGESTCGSQNRWGHGGWEGTGQPSLPTGFFGGGTEAGPLSQGLLVVAGAAPAPGLPTTDIAHSRDAAAAVGHVATAD